MTNVKDIKRIVMIKSILIIVLGVMLVACLGIGLFCFVGAVKNKVNNKYPEVAMFTSIANKIMPFVNDGKESTVYSNINELWSSNIITKNDYDFLISNDAIYNPLGVQTSNGKFFLACRYEKEKTWIIAMNNGSFVMDSISFAGMD